MAVWELAALVFAITYMIVNLVVLGVYLKIASKLFGFTERSFKVIEKMMAKYEQELDED